MQSASPGRGTAFTCSPRAKGEGVLSGSRRARLSHTLAPTPTLTLSPTLTLNPSRRAPPSVHAGRAIETTSVGMSFRSIGSPAHLPRPATWLEVG